MNHICDITHLHMWRDSSIYLTWPIYMCLKVLLLYSRTRSRECTTTWLIRMCGATHSYVCHDPVICVTRLIHMCGVANPYVWYDSFTCVTWLTLQDFRECLHRVAAYDNKIMFFENVYTELHTPYTELHNTIYLTIGLQRMADKITLFENVHIELNTPCTLALSCSVWQTKPHFSRMFTLSCTHCAPRCTCALAHGCTHRVCERESERRKRERKTKMKVLEPTCTSRVPFLSLSFPSLSLYLSFSHPRFPLSFSLSLSLLLFLFLYLPFSLGRENASIRVHMCDMTHSWVPRTGLEHRSAPTVHISRDMTYSYGLHGSLLCTKWLIYMCDTTHLHVWHDSFICVTWLIYMCDTTHLYVWHDSFICVTWLIHVCDKSHSYMCPILFFISVTVKTHFVYVTRLIHMCDMMFENVYRAQGLSTELQTQCTFSMQNLKTACGFTSQ